jgi:hypothetical protein
MLFHTSDSHVFFFIFHLPTTKRCILQPCAGLV